MVVLYSEVILDHFRHPRNYGDLPGPDVSSEAFNPLCGDRIRIELRFKDSIVVDACFKGDGCAISIAAASLLTEQIKGADLKAIVALTDDEIINSLESEISPARIQCALLALGALRAGLMEFPR
jgi:nitrogen fixation NifU-like protein